MDSADDRYVLWICICSILMWERTPSELFDFFLSYLNVQICPVNWSFLYEKLWKKLTEMEVYWYISVNNSQFPVAVYIIQI